MSRERLTEFMVNFDDDVADELELELEHTSV